MNNLNIFLYLVATKNIVVSRHTQFVMQKSTQRYMKCPCVTFVFFTNLSRRFFFLKYSLLSTFVSPVLLSLSFSLSPHLSVSRLHVSPGQQAGAVETDEGVAMGTEGLGC